MITAPVAGWVFYWFGKYRRVYWIGAAPLGWIAYVFMIFAGAWVASLIAE